jgi:O-acetyl-ADP-ribose deacetylase (regulator of RNase III)
MSEKCPVYLGNNCILKSLFTKEFNSRIFNLELAQLENKYSDNCQGLITSCSFKLNNNIKMQEKTAEQEQEKQPVPPPETGTKVSIHKCDNPYLVKADVLVYPANNILSIDDMTLNRMSKNKIQLECDSVVRPIKMGSVYETSNGGETSNVKSSKIYHAVVAGESRLVNEADIKLAIRKSLHLANENKTRNVVMIPPDCGTHDLNDTCRVHLSAIYTYLSSEKDCSIKNIFIVMSDEESFDVYKEYYRRVFKK